ncbi:MAG: serine acetyltransferase [Lachnospiraceae bacterium]|nr:serine acetyltransferase [Lachnospiraceae bacterium]
MDKIIRREIDNITDSIVRDYERGRTIDKVDIFSQPDKSEIINILNELFEIVYAGYYRDRSFKIYNISSKLPILIEDVMFHLNRQITLALRYLKEYADCDEACVCERAQIISTEFFRRIPKIRELLETDLEAAFDGDPATGYREEIIMSYPGFFAITVNRLAHELFLLGVPLIPRTMTEYAHSITGIDIHPGATIGRYFFIDHGTGVVIGETTVIGEYVKIYQGVTLGALSTRGGQQLRGRRRHPTIEDRVTIYSGASILGGETVIGHDAVIGSNAFITSSIEAGTRVSIKNQELNLKSGSHDAPKELVNDEAWYYTI